MGVAVLNGQLPDFVLRSVPWDASERLRLDVLYSFVLLNQAFRARFGHDLRINDSYRTLSRQELYYKNPPSGVGTAAPPGTSNHGWGLAVDLQLTTEEYRWMLANAPRFGWHNPEWARDGKGIEEPWHWENSAAKYIVPDVVRAPVEEDDMFSDADRTMIKDALTKLKRQDLKFVYFRTPDNKPALACPDGGWYAIAPSEAVLKQHRSIMTSLGKVVDGTSVDDWDDLRVKALGVAPNGDFILDPEAFVELREWKFYPGGNFHE